ncbi:tol-pal system-associated acyl-CoA thioesterase [Catenovulum maritimum]|uniref:Acyl-CoA thioesterase n=1 Tax=Catenovulum maritimum TaxID=1513271 RepID=A0A0J8GXJ3_9ALTE|nr:tol-pal system-associated acyl-CoA thioesterase [Catenovulum maritimum]KMT65468.1 acyl-CoA thioesterase [Catenovulum maritimum]
MTQIFRHSIRVYYEDTDAGGIVYHANYLKYYERARTEFLSHLGVEQDQSLSDGFGFVVKRLNMDNVRAAKFNQRLEICSQICQLKRASLTFKQWIEYENNTINKAEIEIAFIDLKNLKPVRIPQPIFGEFQRVC